MTCFEIVLAIVNIVAVIAAPIIAVQIGQYLQDRAQLRKDKMDVFKTLMANRVGWSTASVYAMNIIDIVFADDTQRYSLKLELPLVEALNCVIHYRMTRYGTTFDGSF